MACSLLLAVTHRGPVSRTTKTCLLRKSRQQLDKICRLRGMECAALTSARMVKGQFAGVQHRSSHTQPSAYAPIRGVSDYRVTNRSKVYSNLVSATCFETALDKC